MWLRMKKNKNDKWTKYHVSILDFFCWNLVMGPLLGLAWTVLAYIYFLVMFV